MGNVQSWEVSDALCEKVEPLIPCVSRNPSKQYRRNFQVDVRGTPLAVITTGTSRHDVTQVEAGLDSVMGDLPEPTPVKPQHLCADKVFESEQALAALGRRGHTHHVRSRGEEEREKTWIPGYRTRRWVVVDCHS